MQEKRGDLPQSDNPVDPSEERETGTDQERLRKKKRPLWLRLLSWLGGILGVLLLSLIHI